MHNGPELADILALSIVQQHFPNLQFTLCLTTRTNANSTKRDDTPALLELEHFGGWFLFRRRLHGSSSSFAETCSLSMA